MNQYIVTVRLDRNPEHDPRNKKVGPCPFSSECTDVTGEHHSFIFLGDNFRAAQDTLEGYHVTRIELID